MGILDCLWFPPKPRKPPAQHEEALRIRQIQKCFQSSIYNPATSTPCFFDELVRNAIRYQLGIHNTNDNVVDDIKRLLGVIHAKRSAIGAKGRCRIVDCDATSALDTLVELLLRYTSSSAGCAR